MSVVVGGVTYKAAQYAEVRRGRSCLARDGPGTAFSRCLCPPPARRSGAQTRARQAAARAGQAGGATRHRPESVAESASGQAWRNLRNGDAWYELFTLSRVADLAMRIPVVPIQLCLFPCLSVSVSVCVRNGLGPPGHQTVEKLRPAEAASWQFVVPTRADTAEVSAKFLEAVEEEEA